MRIADKMNFEQVNANIGRNRAEMADLQNQAATQKRVNRPSDDPLAAARVLASRTQISGNAQFMKSVNVAKSFLEYSEQSLGELTEALMRAKELAISQSTDAGANERTREVAATEVGQLFAQTVQIGNRKLGDRFLFGGFKTTEAPFDPEGRYRGDDGLMEIAIDREAKVAMNVPGSRAFLGKNVRGAPSQPAPGESRERSSGPAVELASAPTEEDLEARKDPARAIASLRPPSIVELGEPSETPSPPSGPPGIAGAGGANVFKVLRDFEIALRTNDKDAVQSSLDAIDDALAQAVLVRAELGARVGTLSTGMESLQKGQVDAKTLASSLEDADAFELVSDINKSESTLKATLATSGKLIQPSLLDFLR